MLNDNFKLEQKVKLLEKALAERTEECKAHLSECDKHLKALEALKKENQLLKSKKRVVRKKVEKKADKE